MEDYLVYVKMTVEADSEAAAYDKVKDILYTGFQARRPRALYDVFMVEKKNSPWAKRFDEEFRNGAYDRRAAKGQI